MSCERYSAAFPPPPGAKHLRVGLSARCLPQGCAALFSLSNMIILQALPKGKV